MDARLREWAERLGLHVHVLDRTSELGAILVAGPRARDLVDGLTEDPIDAASLRTRAIARLTVAGVPCRAIRSGFVGELAFELHHPRSNGPELWTSLQRAGRDVGSLVVRARALELLRLEKGVYLGQDSLPDDTPAKLGLARAVDMTKPWFVGKGALERLAELPPTRRLAGLVFEAQPTAPGSGARRSPSAPPSSVASPRPNARPCWIEAIGLGWIRRGEDGFPNELRAGGAVARVVPTRSTTARARGSVAELRTWAPTVTSVLASAEACDRVGDLPGACRVSPGEVALVGDVSEAAVAAAVVRLDPDAVVLDVSDGWVAHSLDGPGSRGLRAPVRARAADRGLPVGEVAGVGVRILVDRDRIDLLVPSMVSAPTRAHRDRLRGAVAMTGLLRKVRFLEQRELRPGYDVVIVGGGVNGLSLAYHLAEVHGIRDVAVLERSYLGSGASGRNTQVLRANYNTPETVPLYEASLQLYRTLSQELDFNVMFTDNGELDLCHTPDSLRVEREKSCSTGRSASRPTSSPPRRP